MKKLSIILILLFSVMFSFNCFAKWEYLTRDINDNTFYLDYERIRKVDNFIYFWVLTNFSSIDKFGELSTIYYREGDCKLFRDRDLEVRGFTKSMGKGIMKQYKPEITEFETPFPNTVNERILNVICNR